MTSSVLSTPVTLNFNTHQNSEYYGLQINDKVFRATVYQMLAVQSPSHIAFYMYLVNTFFSRRRKDQTAHGMLKAQVCFAFECKIHEMGRWEGERTPLIHCPSLSGNDTSPSQPPPSGPGVCYCPSGRKNTLEPVRRPIFFFT